MKRSFGGFTLIELVVTLGIFIVLSGVVLINLSAKRTNVDIVNLTERMSATLREAQSNSMAQKNGVAWGVHLENATTTPFYALYFTSYSPTTTVGYYSFPGSVSYATSTLALGATLDILFSQVTGAASASTSINLYMPKQTYYSTILIASSGAVSY